MPVLGVLRFSLSQVAKAIALALVFFSFAGEKAFAAADWSAIQTALGATGTEMPGNVLRFELCRSDLPMTVNGAPPNTTVVGESKRVADPLAETFGRSRATCSSARFLSICTVRMAFARSSLVAMA